VLGVAAVQIGGTVALAADQVQPGSRPLDPVAFLVLGASALALLWRRQRPVAVLAATFVGTVAYYYLGYPAGPAFLPLMAALYTAAVTGHRLPAWIAAVLLEVHVLLAVLVGADDRPDLAAVVVVGWLLTVLGAAEVVRARRAARAEVERRIEEAERRREEEARRRAGAERLRMARELHDVLAHSISLINVQAGVALHLLDEHPEQARTALAAVKQASKEALRELRSTLGLLREADEVPPRLPPPSLTRVDELIGRAAAAGLDVRAEVEGECQPLPAPVDQAAYRIVQEALTNVLRHAGPAAARVHLRYDERALVVRVEDDGSGPGVLDGHSGGNGIPGMRERVAALGGQLEAGPRPDGGFRVLARLPTDGGAG
jgi:signal transduction histidine kinase